MIQFLPARLRTPWLWLFIGLAAVYFRGLFLDVMDVDASQYASISMEMLQTGNWLQVHHHQMDYLDKPPLLFWTSALSFALFGLHNWAYKLPSFLAALGGVYAVYRFCLLYYPEKTARLAAFILASCFGTLLLCNDVRTDTLLMALTICAVWQLAAYLTPPQPPQKGGGGASLSTNGKLERSASPPLLGGLGGAFLFIGLAMLAKGPIGLVLPAFAAGTHLLLRRDWKRIFDWKWLIGLAVAALVLAPMCWGLYQQFDLHPEKTVNERSGVSGLYFFFWEQSFGRITGENVWKNDTSPFYFLHVYGWAFLPWPLLLVAALWRRGSDLFRQRFRLPDGDEAFSMGAFVLTFIALSLSRYKLPHYIFITLPWAAVLTARWLTVPPGEDLLNLKFKSPSLARGWYYAQYFVLFLLSLVSILLTGFVFPTANPLVWGIVLGLFGYVLVKTVQKPFPDMEVLAQRSVLAFLGAAFVLNFHFYPHLLPYQSTAAVPRFARQASVPVDKIGWYNRHGNALDFYAGRIIPKLETPDDARKAAIRAGEYWIYTNEEGRLRLDSAGVRYSETAAFGHFQVALLKPAFLNPATRPRTLEPVYLLKILPE